MVIIIYFKVFLRELLLEDIFSVGFLLISKEVILYH